MSIGIPVFNRLSDLSLNFIGDFIKWLVNNVGDVGLGIILFTIGLKLITLPLDIYSKASMRKNSLKMEKMRPQLEKLKKQYANDKVIYNQKMMALYKKEGYSMFGACLPTLVTLVFFIIVLTAFQSYSKYATLTTFNDMRGVYTEKVQEYTGIDNILDETELQAMVTSGKIDTADESIASAFIKEQARQASANVYRNADLSFLWVKNIWIADNATTHPVLSYSKFISTIKLSGDESFSESAYEELTYNLDEEKSQPNGFFIFIVLSIAVTLLSQWVLGKSQKASLELQSVDGKGMQTQKMMMYIMPVMIGVFAFMYTSAFCIYMVSNSILTIITTIVINKIVDIKFKHNEKNLETQKLNSKYNRVESGRYNKKIK
jgi:YidC/Oxa1 family membrane protein insertase